MPHAPLLPMALHNLVHVCHACACAWGASTRAPTAAQPAPWPPGLRARMHAAAERAQASAAARRALHGSSAARRRPCGGCRPRSRRPGSPGRPRERALRGIVGPARVLWTGLARDVSARPRAISGLGWAAQVLRYATCRRGVVAGLTCRRSRRHRLHRCRLVPLEVAEVGRGNRHRCSSSSSC